MDGNCYDAYQDSFYYLYESVPVGGYIIFDDIFSHGNVMSFWKHFKKEQRLKEELVRIDKHSAWFRKASSVKLDWSFFRAPQDGNKPSYGGLNINHCPKIAKCHATWSWCDCSKGHIHNDK